jgi:cytochrome oxidase Cu insertion factor (SCO1/SenC/PrrC family)
MTLTLLPPVAGSQVSGADATVLLNRLPANWRDDHGEQMKLATLQGRRIFVTMAYSTCHRICPLTLARLADLQRDLDVRGLSAEFLIVSYDPSNDDAAAWHRYRTSHGLLRGNWHFLVGTQPDTERLASILGFEYWRDGEHVMHDFRIVALADDGTQRGVIDSVHGDWQSLL